ncbi:MAG: hypothetical protein IKQ41_05945 [Clostridia bacterium]|nr:hypothetical protein [Clostridia bacterium]
MIDLNVFAEKSAREFAAGRSAPSLTDAWALRAFAALYQADGKPQFRETVLSWLEKRVSRDGKIDLPMGDGGGYKKEALGAAILFADRETQDARYRLAADQLMETAGNIPSGQIDESTAAFSMEEAFLLMPFRAEYDARLGTKQLARFIAARFLSCRKALTLESLPLPILGLYLSALSDTLEKMEIQLYEHYRALADLLTEAAGLALRRWEAQSGLLDAPPQNAPALGGCALTAYALMKGVRLGALDEEKYLKKAQLAFGRLMDILPDGADDPQGKKAKYACLMALAEEGRAQKE